MLSNVLRVLSVLWAGSLWSVSWVTWVMFNRQSDRHLAGVLAGPLFSIEAWLAIAVVALAVLSPARKRFTWGYAAAALLTLGEWGVRPLMASARAHGSMFGLTFGAWHGVSALLYLLASLAVLRFVWKGEAFGRP